MDPRVKRRRPRPPRGRIGALALALSVVAARGTELAPEQRLYEMRTHTGMPHLEENLRYAVVTEQRCLNPHDLSTVFWMLGDASLQDCKLARVLDEPAHAVYALHCSGGHGTSGEARWELTPQRLTGVLNVRLGGKNMTFYQRITATPIGACR